MDTFGGLISLTNRMPVGVKFKRIECGYSHALLISEDDRLYVFGAGLYGQLGLGFEDLKTKYPVPLEDINSDHEKVLKIACGANFSLCYTALGIVYYWGMLVPEDVSSITWLPSFLTIAFPQRHEMALDGDWESFALTDLKATFREILACDAAGRVYHCDLNYTQTLKPYSLKIAGHKVLIGRSQHMFLDSILSPSDCRVLPESFPGASEEEEDLPELETMMDNLFSVRLCDSDGAPYYAPITSPEELRQRYPISVVLSTSEKRMAIEFPRFNYIDLGKTGAKDPKDEEGMVTFNPGCVGSGGEVENQVRFKV